MPTIQLTDDFGLNVSLTPGAALSKYFKNLADLHLKKVNLSQIKDADITHPLVTDLQGGINFSKDIEIGNPAVELTIAASANGDLSIFVPSPDGGLLFDPDMFGDNIKVNANQRYVSLSLSAQLEAGASVSPGDLTFGFDAKSAVTLAYHQQFSAGTTVIAAVKTVIENFRLPADLDDIADMPVGSIATVDSTGDLTFSGSITLPITPNPVATVKVPLAGAISVNAGASFTVAADYELTGEYQIRVQKLPGSIFHLGVYKKRGTTFDISAGVGASLAVQLGDKDLVAALLKKISSDPQADLDQLASDGLSADQSSAIQTAVQNAVNRSLEIGASLELSREADSTAMFLYELDLAAIQPDGRAMIHSALEGNFSPLGKTDIHPPAGIRTLKTLLTSTRTSQATLKINLLGIFNVLRVSTLLKQGQAAWDAITGQLVLTDSVASDKIDIFASNFQVKDSQKLRSVLAEHFLVTASYSAVNNMVGLPDLAGSQTYFVAEHNPGRVRMRDYFLISATLGLQSRAMAMSAVPKLDDFGATTVYAEANYDAAACRALFFEGDNRVSADAYVRAGRQAIANLVLQGDDDDFRLTLANDDELFRQLKEIGVVASGQFALACVNKGIPSANVLAVGTDYLNIVWFSGAFMKAGDALQAIDGFLRKNPHPDPNNHDFLNLRRKLTNSLASVVSKANVDFGGPWGFEALACLGKAASTQWVILNQHVTQKLSSSAKEMEIAVKRTDGAVRETVSR